MLIEFDTVYYYQMANLNDRSPYKGHFMTVYEFFIIMLLSDILNLEPI